MVLDGNMAFITFILHTCVQSESFQPFQNGSISRILKKILVSMILEFVSLSYALIVKW